MVLPHIVVQQRHQKGEILFESHISPFNVIDLVQSVIGTFLVVKLVVSQQIVAQQDTKKERFFKNRTSLPLNVIDSVQQVIGPFLMFRLYSGITTDSYLAKTPKRRYSVRITNLFLSMALIQYSK